MKRMLILLLLLLMLTPALAEDSPFAPFALTLPEGTQLTENEGSHTVILEDTRVVVQLIPRVPDESPAEALPQLMVQFAPKAVLGEDLPLMEGCVGMLSADENSLGEGIDQLVAMVLYEGDLLILSAYDTTGDTEAAAALLDALLQGVTVGGELIYIN